MRIGFLISRNTCYKHFGAIINEALKRGHEVFCFHDYSQPRDGNKGYQFPSLSDMPKFAFGNPKAINFNHNAALIEKIKENKVQVLVSSNMLGSNVELKNTLSAVGIFWVALQPVCDSLFTAEFWHVPDIYLVYSLTWVELAVECLLKTKIIPISEKENTKQRLLAKSVAVGFPELDQDRMIDASKIKKDWGIPEDKKVVLFLPFTFNSCADRFWIPFVYGKNNLFIQALLVLFYPILFPLLVNKRPKLGQWLGFWGQVFRKENDKTLMKSLKKFCQKNNAYLLVKSRKKDPVKPYLARIADKVLYDEELYPSTIVKCMKVSDLCCNFYSASVLEAAFMGVPGICLAPTLRDWSGLQYKEWEVIFEKANDFHDFPGVSYKLSIPEAIRAFSEKTLADFPLNKEKQKEYVKKFVGDLDDEYSLKAVKAIENLAEIE